MPSSIAFALIFFKSRSLIRMLIRLFLLRLYRAYSSYCFFSFLVRSEIHSSFSSDLAKSFSSLSKYVTFFIFCLQNIFLLLCCLVLLFSKIFFRYPQHTAQNKYNLRSLQEKLSDSDILPNLDVLPGRSNLPMLLPIQPVQMTRLVFS